MKAHPTQVANLLRFADEVETKAFNEGIILNGTLSLVETYEEQPVVKVRFKTYGNEGETFTTEVLEVK